MLSSESLHSRLELLKVEPAFCPPLMLVIQGVSLTPRQFLDQYLGLEQCHFHPKGLYRLLVCARVKNQIVRPLETFQLFDEDANGYIDANESDRKTALKVR